MSNQAAQPDRFGENTTITFAYLRAAAQRCLAKAEETEEGSFYQSMLALMSAAMMMEAYLNHIGPVACSDWLPQTDEWLKPKEKLKRVARAIALELNSFGSGYEAFRTLVQFRNQLAHGRTTTVTGDWSAQPESPESFNALEPDWMKLCNPSDARRLIDGVESVLRMISSKAKGVGDPFLLLSSGFSQGSGSLPAST